MPTSSRVAHCQSSANHIFSNYLLTQGQFDQENNGLKIIRRHPLKAMYVISGTNQIAPFEGSNVGYCRCPRVSAITNTYVPRNF